MSDCKLFLFTFCKDFERVAFGFALKLKGTMDEKLDVIMEKFWKWRLKEAPEFGTLVGDHSCDDKLNDMSLDAYDKRLVSIFVFAFVTASIFAFFRMVFTCAYLTAFDSPCGYLSALMGKNYAG